MTKSEIVVSPSIEEIKKLLEYYRLLKPEELKTIKDLIIYFKSRTSNESTVILECTKEEAEKVIRILNIQIGTGRRELNTEENLEKRNKL